MKDKRIWLVILGILVIGILVTGYTRSVVKKQADSAAFEGEISTEASLGPFKEQTEEEDITRDILEKFTMAGNDMAAKLFLDRELGSIK